MRKPTGFATRSDTNRAVRLQKMVGGLKFQIEEVERLYCIHVCSSENKGTDHLRAYRAANLPLCFRIRKSRFSYNAAHFVSLVVIGNDF